MYKALKDTIILFSLDILKAIYEKVLIPNTLANVISRDLFLLTQVHYSLENTDLLQKSCKLDKVKKKKSSAS